jgi:hypothetical protein
VDGTFQEETPLIVKQDACTDGMQKEQPSTDCVESEGEDLEGETSVDSRRNSISADDEEPWIQNFFAEDSLSDLEQQLVEENPFTKMDSTLFNQSEVVSKNHKDHDDLESLKLSVSDLENWSFPEATSFESPEDEKSFPKIDSSLLQELEDLKNSVNDYNDLANLKLSVSNLKNWSIREATTFDSKESDSVDEFAGLTELLSASNLSHEQTKGPSHQADITNSTIPSSSKATDDDENDPMIDLLRALYNSPQQMDYAPEPKRSYKESEDSNSSIEDIDQSNSLDIDQSDSLSSELPIAPNAIDHRLENSVVELKQSSARADIVFAKEGEELSDEQKEINELISSMRKKRGYGKSITTDDIPNNKPKVQTRPRSNSAPDVLVRH